MSVLVDGRMYYQELIVCIYEAIVVQRKNYWVEGDDDVSKVNWDERREGGGNI